MATTKAHGTVRRYSTGCRCRACRTAWAGYCRKRAHTLGRRTRAEYLAARRLNLTRRPGEDEKSFQLRVAGRTHTVTPRTEPYYDGKVDTDLRVRPTSLGLQLLDAVIARTGRDQHDIFEHLLRNCSDHIKFDDAPQP